MDVHQDDVVGSPIQRFQSLDAVVHGVGLIAELLQHVEDDDLVDRVVLRQEDAQRPVAGRVGLSERLGRLRRGERRGLADDREMKRRSLIRGGFHRHRAAHELRQSFADRQSEACAAVVAARGAVELLEGDEEPLDVVAGDAGAGVGDGEADLDAAVCH